MERCERSFMRFPKGASNLSAKLRCYRFTLACIAVLALAACGGAPRQVSGELPQVLLDGLSLDGERLLFDLGIRNVNDRALDVTSLILQLELDGRAATQREQHRIDLNITARGREVIRLEAPVDPRGRRLLDELTAGERGSLAYQLEVEFDGQRRRRLEDTIARGFLHAVPGQPGRFR
jgi:hypothetical protein